MEVKLEWKSEGSIARVEVGSIARGITAVSSGSCSEFWWHIYHFIICKCHKLLFNHRDVVRCMLLAVDPVGVHLRAKHRIIQRRYRLDVSRLFKIIECFCHLDMTHYYMKYT